MQTPTDTIINERAQQYGLFIQNSTVAQSLKNTLATALIDREPLPPDLAEALEMICSKMSRIVCGNEKAWADNLLDIAGYATLVHDRIQGNPR